VQFSGERSTPWQEKFRPKPSDQARWILREVYYHQRHFKIANKRFAQGAEIEMPARDRLPKGWSWPPDITVDDANWDASLTREDGRRLVVRQDGHVGWDPDWQRPSLFGVLDWIIVGIVFLAIVGGVLLTKRYMKSVADFLAAAREIG